MTENGLSAENEGPDSNKKKECSISRNGFLTIMLIVLVVEILFYTFANAKEELEYDDTKHMRHETVEKSIKHYLTLKKLYEGLIKAEGFNEKEEQRSAVHKNPNPPGSEEQNISEVKELTQVKKKVEYAYHYNGKDESIVNQKTTT